MNEFQNWSTDTLNSLNTLTYQEAVKKLIEEEDMENKAKPYRTIFPALDQFLGPVLLSLRKRMQELARGLLKEISKQIEELGKIHPGNLARAGEFICRE